jgi:5-methylcytosine-specific restriction endonuclease McrA
MNEGTLELELMMKRVFGAAEWREVFLRCKDSDKSRRAWLYNAYIGSDAWNRKKVERRAIDRDKCQGCIRVDRLEVHHKTYERIGDENVETDLVTLCERCHGELHGRKAEEIFPRDDAAAGGVF